MVLLLTGGLAFQASAQSDRATVSIMIKVDPIAQMDLDGGSEFKIYIPTAAETRGRPFAFGAPPHVSLAQVPFTVRGNTRVTVSASPDPLSDATGKGQAIAVDGSGETVGFRVVLDFPSGSTHKPLKGLGARGQNATGKTTRSADASAGPMSGVVYIVPDVTRGEVASRRVPPGWYSGAVQVVVTVDD